VGALVGLFFGERVGSVVLGIALIAVPTKQRVRDVLHWEKQPR
jgi:hypothetical protein